MHLPSKPKKDKKPLFILGSICVVLVIIAGTILWLKRPTPTDPAAEPTAPVNTVDYDPPSATDTNNPTLNETNLLGEGKPPAEPAPPAPNNISIIITRADQAAVGEALNFRSIVHGTSQGTCTIKLTKDGQTVTRTASITFEVSSTHCNFDIPAQDFATSGAWELAMTVDDNQNTASAKQTITVTK